MKPRRPRVVKWLIVLGTLAVLGMGGVCATCMYVGMVAPDTKVLSGRQIPKKFMDQIRDLDVLEPGEQIQYFYSDGLLNIEEGFYLITERKVVVYSREYDEPAILVPFSEIAEIDADFSNTWLGESWITLTLTDGTSVSFPASSEGGGDRKMEAALAKQVEKNKAP